MKREVVWTWSAEVDSQEAFGIAEDEAAGNGTRLVATVENLLDLLSRFPEMTRVWRPPVRRALIRRTHYGLFYVVEKTRLVIIAMHDLRRDPALLEEELRRRLP